MVEAVKFAGLPHETVLAIMIRIFLTVALFALQATTYAQTPKAELTAIAEADANAVQILINDGEFENAIARVDVALKKNRKNPRLLLQRGLILVNLGMYQKAAAHYKSLKRKLRNNPEPANNLAMVYRLEGDYVRAIKEFKSAIKKFPDYVPAYENLGDTYIELAQQVFQSGLSAHPDSQILASKVELGKTFNDIALSNTPQSRRQSLANQSNEEVHGTQEKVPAADEEAIVDALGQWISYWSNRNVEGFLSHYSSEFVPPDNVPLPQWIETSRQTIAQAKFIRIKLDNIQFRQINQGRIEANFSFYYESDSVTERLIMTLTFKRSPNQWLIAREESRAIG